jgi:peptide/nickel transport system ATP-binding protein
MKLELKGVRVRYGTGRNAVVAVDGIDLAVKSGQTLGLVGESGCGKSTVARAIVGLVPITAGTLLLDGQDYASTAKRNTPAFRRKVQMIFQDPYSSLNPRMSIKEMLDEVLSKAGSRRSNRRADALEVLDLVGMPASALDRYPHQFSGGQRQRLAIARALALHPDVIINDEVTSALDVSVQGTILNLLRDLQRNLNLSYVFISHDLSTVRYMSDRVSVMYLGRIVETGATEDVFRSPSHPYTEALIGSIPQIGQARKPAPLSGDLPDPRNPPLGCRFHTRCPVGPVYNQARGVCIESDPQAMALARRHESACHFAPALSGSGPARSKAGIGTS